VKAKRKQFGERLRTRLAVGDPVANTPPFGRVVTDRKNPILTSRDSPIRSRVLVEVGRSRSSRACSPTTPRASVKPASFSSVDTLLHTHGCSAAAASKMHAARRLVTARPKSVVGLKRKAGWTQAERGSWVQHWTIGHPEARPSTSTARWAYSFHASTPSCGGNVSHSASGVPNIRTRKRFARCHRSAR